MGQLSTIRLFLPSPSYSEFPLRSSQEADLWNGLPDALEGLASALAAASTGVLDEERARKALPPSLDLLEYFADQGATHARTWGRYRFWCRFGWRPQPLLVLADLEGLVAVAAAVDALQQRYHMPIPHHDLTTYLEEDIAALVDASGSHHPLTTVPQFLRMMRPFFQQIHAIAHGQACLLRHHGVHVPPHVTIQALGELVVITKVVLQIRQALGNVLAADEARRAHKPRSAGRAA